MRGKPLNTTRTRLCVVAALLIVLALNGSAVPVQAMPVDDPEPRLTPVVLFSGWFLTRLEVRVHNQTVAPECPASGTFESTVLNAHPSAEFSQICQDRLMTVVYDRASRKAMAKRFSNQPGVQVDIADYGMTESAPLYEPMYAFLEQAGYTRNVNIRVAGYDGRLTPDMGGFLKRTVKLIEETYRANHNTPVHLVGHSNGPLYAHYLLTHTSQRWKDKYIHGFTPIAGNFPGSGFVYAQMFLGFNVNDVSYPTEPANAVSSAAMYLSSPMSYATATDPAYFGDQEVVIRTVQGGKEYTPRDYRELFGDAGLDAAAEIADYYLGFIEWQPPNYLYVDVYAEKGSGFPTAVGIELQNLSLGQTLGDAPVLIMADDGDLNQEAITNDAIAAWESMPCYHFELNDNPGVNHYVISDDPVVLGRLLDHLQTPRSECGAK